MSKIRIGQEGKAGELDTNGCCGFVIRGVRKVKREKVKLVKLSKAAVEVAGI